MKDYPCNDLIRCKEKKLRKLIAIICYLKEKNINNNFLTEKENFFYIIYLGGLKHLVEFMGRDLLENTLHGLINLNSVIYKKHYNSVYDIVTKNNYKYNDFKDFLSISDINCLDWSIENVDFLTYNYDIN